MYISTAYFLYRNNVSYINPPPPLYRLTLQWKLASKGDLMDSKLKCTFVDVSPEEQPNSEETVTTSKVQVCVCVGVCVSL